MGQASSVPVVGRRKSFRSSWRSRIPSRSRSHKGNLSATFNILDIDTKIDQLNVNIATEEELMTLPGVCRADAHSIVEYRQRLGRFKKVEDLALVSGIGADKLALIRPEICVGPRRSPSCASSRAQSIDSLPSVDVKPSPRPMPLTNINTATVFELQTIPGFTQEIAANVVDYRDTHGTFANLDQLTKVKGINHIRLGAIRSRLTVSTDQIIARNGFPPSFNVIHSTPKSSPKLSTSHSTQPIVNGKISGHRKTMSVPVKLAPASNGLAVRDILDVLSACSPRPIVEDHFDGRRKGRPAIRIASWNLSGLCADKAENPGVREVICRTILENSEFHVNSLAVHRFLKSVNVSYLLCYLGPVVGKWSGEGRLLSLEKVEPFDKESSVSEMLLSIEDTQTSFMSVSRFSLVVLQEVLSYEALEKICNELNCANLRRVKEWKENSHKWHYQCSKGLGVLWDGNENIELSTVNVLKLNDLNNFSDILCAEFLVGSLHISVSNVFMHESSMSDSHPDICTVIQNHFSGGGNINQVIVGDFSTLLSKKEDCSELFGAEYKAMLPPRVSTNSIISNHHTVDIQFNDNIFISKALCKQFTDMSGVVRQGLTHLAIPRCWSWGGPASEHCPVWCELYIEKKSMSPCTTKKD